MCIGTKTVAGITYYAQWISVQGTNDWLLCGIISYPEPNRAIGSDLMFQEDFMSNNLCRQCLIKNAFGRYNGTSSWHTWNTYNLTNDFYKYTDSQVPIVVRYDCFYEIDNSQAIRIRSGGEDLQNPVNNNIYPPEPLTITSSTTPAFNPNWSEAIPRYIKNKEGDLYISIGVNDVIVLSSTPYYWFFIDTNDDYYFILNEDKTKALTIEGTYTGAAILLSSFAQLPDIQGVGVFNGTDFGVYIGGGEVVFSSAIGGCVQRQALSDGDWTSWCTFDAVTYPQEVTEQETETTTGGE